jgi:hypothetical protein
MPPRLDGKRRRCHGWAGQSAGPVATPPRPIAPVGLPLDVGAADPTDRRLNRKARRRPFTSAAGSSQRGRPTHGDRLAHHEGIGRLVTTGSRPAISSPR